MIPHEKALVERLANEPFALIGINTDGDKEQYRKQAQASGVTWRSAWDGSTRGPLCTAWGITSFPTIYVLDARGTIRHIGLRGTGLEDAVMALIREAKASQGESPSGEDRHPEKSGSKLPEDPDRTLPPPIPGQGSPSDGIPGSAELAHLPFAGPARGATGLFSIA
jgi:hypothetical protein